MRLFFFLDECAANVDSCDDATTTCVPDADGAAVCDCLPGFEPVPGSATECQQSVEGNGEGITAVNFGSFEALAIFE